MRLLDHDCMEGADFRAVMVAAGPFGTRGRMHSYARDVLVTQWGEGNGG